MLKTLNRLFPKMPKKDFSNNNKKKQSNKQKQLLIRKKKYHLKNTMKTEFNRLRNLKRHSLLSHILINLNLLTKFPKFLNSFLTEFQRMVNF